MFFSITKDTIIDLLQKGVTQQQIDDTVSGINVITSIC